MNKEIPTQVRRFLSQIDKLSKYVRREHFLKDGIPNFLEYQNNIGRLQREIQKAITETKRKLNQGEDKEEVLEYLKFVRWHARRLGDAVAWNTLLHDRRNIIPLGDNTRVPIPGTVEPGSIGVEEIVKVLVSAGWGLPILHDITDCLRIGDITFLNFEGTDDQKHITRTIEVKTKMVSETLQPDGSRLLQLEIQTIGTEEGPEGYIERVRGMIPENEPSEPSEPAKRRRRDRRLSKQLDRMQKAQTLKLAESYEVVVADGRQSLTIDVPEIGKDYWTELRRALREARRTGYSYFSVDQAIGWAILYNEEGIQSEDINNSLPLAEDLQNSILSKSEGTRDSVTLLSIPASENDEYTKFVLPHYLWPVPRRAISDILYSRIAIIALINFGKIEEALKDAGFTIQVDENDDDMRSFNAFGTISWDTGEQFQFALPTPWLDIFTAANEFYGVSGIVSKATSFFELPNKMSIEVFTRHLQEGRNFPLEQ